MTILAGTATRQYSLMVATDDTQVRAAQRLRHQVFADELGATLHSAVPGLDVDEFDGYCDHLVIRDEGSKAVVGTYRMLPPDRAGRLYSDGEFHLAPLAALRPALVETGRSCVHPEHRTGAVINLMWAGIARYMLLSGHRWLAGCASVPTSDIDGVWQQARAKSLAPPAWRVRPRNPWPLVEAGAPADGTAKATMPPLLRGYLRLGAWVCGPPAHDPDFGVADLFVLLSLDRVDPRYLRHFLGEP
jgi:putative hemolysin